MVGKLVFLLENMCLSSRPVGPHSDSRGSLRHGLALGCRNQCRAEVEFHAFCRDGLVQDRSPKRHCVVFFKEIWFKLKIALSGRPSEAKRNNQ